MENIKWLVENGGPAIKIHMVNEGLINKDSYDVEKQVDEFHSTKIIKSKVTRI